MPNSNNPTRIPLTGADCFLRAFDAETRRKNDASHMSQLVLRLGPGFDVELFRHWITEAASSNPILRSPVAKRFWVGAPEYRTELAPLCPLPTIQVHEGRLPAECGRLDDSVPIPELFYQRLNETHSLKQGDLLRFDLVQYDRGKLGTDLAMTWIHLLFDGSGSENFIRYIDECFRGPRRIGDLPADDIPDAKEGGLAGLKGRGLQAQAWRENLKQLAKKTPHSLAGPLRKVPQNLRFNLITLSEDETEATLERAKQMAGFLTPMLFYLATSIRAHHAVFEARGLDPGSYVVPLPVNMRPKGCEGAIFRTRVSMMWFQIQKERVASIEDLIADLKEQRKNLIKGGAIVNGSVAMDFARYAPKRIYSQMARNSFHGELCSFFFAYTGEFLGGLESFLGAEIRNGFHSPSVPASPGSSAVFSLREGRLNFTHVFQEDLLSREEHELFQGCLLADLGGTEQ